MKSLKHIFYLTCLVLAIFTSCSIEKRIYRKGYHVVWNHNRSEAKGKVTQVKKENVLVAPPEKIEEFIVSNTENDIQLLSDVKKASFVIGKDTCGDKIYFKNGDIITAKVIEVDRENIKYKRCDNLDGPLFTVGKRSLAMVQYYNGVKEDIVVEPEKKMPEKVAQKPSNGKRTNELALTSFILALLGWFFGLTLIVAIPMAVGSLSQIKKEPDKLEGKGFAVAALVISIIISTFWAYICYLVFTALALAGIPGLNIFSVFFIILAVIALIGLIVMS